MECRKQYIIIIIIFIQKEENEYGPEGKIVYENPDDIKDCDSKKNKKSSSENDDDDDEIDFDEDVEELENPEEIQKRENIKLREYEKQRLKYYFAVVECNSLEASSSIYDQCDGFEYLQSGNIFDMRYIPDDISFENREIKDEATEVPESYEPIDFTTSALEHTKVKLTWDEEDEEVYFIIFIYIYLYIFIYLLFFIEEKSVVEMGKYESSRYRE